MPDAIEQGVTLHDYMALGEDTWAEVVNGEIVVTDMSAASFTHSLVIDNILDLLKTHARKHNLGVVLGDGLTYTLSLVGETIRSARIPDVSFIRRENLNTDFDFDRPYPGKPDLAVEVISPTEHADETQQKIRDYPAAGTEQVWVVYPRQKSLHQYVNGEKVITIYNEGDTFTPEALFPGLEIKIAALFAFGM
ncbi:MAG: Uma2 family endonuclease [Chloroflexota bacterium]